MAATAQTPVAPDASLAANVDGMMSLINALQEHVSPTETYRRSLQTLASHFDAPYAAIRLDSASTNLTYEVSASNSSTSAWKRQCEGMLLSTKYNGKPQARLFHAPGASCTFAVLTVPVPGEGRSAAGALALVTKCGDRNVAEARLSELASLTRAAAFLCSQPKGSRERNTSHDATSESEAATGQPNSPAKGPSSALSRLNGFGSLSEFAFSLVNGLKGKIGADQVSIGLISKDSPRLLCVSGFDNLYPRSPGTHVVKQAMAECYDAQTIVCYQQDGKWSEDSANTGHHLHRAWHEETGNVPVASIPLIDGDRCVAVLSIRRPAGKPFDASELEKIHRVVSSYAAGLELLERANRSFLRHCCDSLTSFAMSVISPGSVGRKLSFCVVGMLLAWGIFGETNYTINTPCEIAPANPLHLAAPFEGAIAESFVRPGDHVKQGQVLLRMDTVLLRTELRQAQSELQIATVERTQAAAKRDLTETALANARIEIAQSDINTIQRKIDRATVRAPHDGSILIGDWRHRVGEVVPLGEPLLEIAESGNWVVKLHVPEFVASYLELGMNGVFATNGRPDEPGQFEIQHMDLTATVVDGRNVLVAEGTIDGGSLAWIRSGMEGVARVDAGKKRVWWVWLHGLVDGIRLQVWKW